MTENSLMSRIINAITVVFLLVVLIAFRTQSTYLLVREFTTFGPGAILLLDSSTGHLYSRIEYPLPNQPVFLATSPQSPGVLAVLDSSSQIRLLDFTGKLSSQASYSLGGTLGSTYAGVPIAVSGTRVVACGNSGVILYSSATETEIGRISRPYMTTDSDRRDIEDCSVRFSQDGEWLGVSFGDVVTIYDTTNWNSVFSFTCPIGIIEVITFSANQIYIAVIGSTRFETPSISSLCVYHIPSQQLYNLSHPDGYEQKFHFVEFSPVDPELLVYTANADICPCSPWPELTPLEDCIHPLITPTSVRFLSDPDSTNRVIAGSCRNCQAAWVGFLMNGTRLFEWQNVDGGKDLGVLENDDVVALPVWSGLVDEPLLPAWAIGTMIAMVVIFVVVVAIVTLGIVLTVRDRRKK